MSSTSESRWLNVAAVPEASATRRAYGIRRGPENREHSQCMRTETVRNRHHRKVGKLFAAELVTDLHARGVSRSSRRKRFRKASFALRRCGGSSAVCADLETRAGRANFARPPRRSSAVRSSVPRAPPPRPRYADRRRRPLPAPPARSLLSVTSASWQFARRALRALEKRVRSSGSHFGAEFEETLRGDAKRGYDDRDAGMRREPDQLDVLEKLRPLLGPSLRKLDYSRVARANEWYDR